MTAVEAPVGVSRLLVPGAIATAMLAALAGLELLGLPTFAIPFVATATILATAPGSPLARTRTVVLAYGLSLVVALAIVDTWGSSTAAAVVAAGLAVLVTAVARVSHPPAAAGAAMVGLQGTEWVFLLGGVLPALAALLAVAVVAGVLVRSYPYRLHW
ncbi:HPP family protein [Georgenia daeguensis]|uniref:HPP transmembrane region domain-containing protein n=1 Tax=Georgenia daeguensis TaxID=908355 RepID=A0ABP8EP79_9MICO